MNGLLAVAVVVSALAALATVGLSALNVSKLNKTIEMMGRQQQEARAAHDEVMKQERDAAAAARLAHDEEMQERQRGLEEELRLERLRQLGHVGEIVNDISCAIHEELALRPNGRFAGPGEVTRIPVERMRLRGAVAALLLAGGPHLAVCHRLAQGSDFTNLVQMIGGNFGVVNAANEIASYLDGEVSRESQPGGRLQVPQ